MLIKTRLNHFLLLAKNYPQRSGNHLRTGYQWMVRLTAGIEERINFGASTNSTVMLKHYLLIQEKFMIDIIKLLNGSFELT